MITNPYPFSGPALEAAILKLLHARNGKTICPSEVARAVAAAEYGAAGAARSAWQPLLANVKDAALRLANCGEIIVTQRGHLVELSTVKGPVRLQLHEKAETNKVIEAARPSAQPLQAVMATTTKKSSAKKVTGTGKNKNCWPGFEPVPGRKPGSKGSCRRIPGEHSASTRKATQRFAAADKLGKQGKPNPHEKIK